MTRALLSSAGQAARKTVEGSLWPFNGGTRRERLGAAAMLLEFWLIWAGLYVLAWTLRQH
jgi:hypothetical protein